MRDRSRPTRRPRPWVRMTTRSYGRSLCHDRRMRAGEIVVGAGIGGLTSAVALELGVWAVRVLGDVADFRTGPIFLGVDP